MKRDLKRAVMMAVILVVVLLGQAAFAYSAYIFIYHAAISAANLGSVGTLNISVYSAEPAQDGGAGLLSEGSNYVLTVNGKYQGATDAIKINVLNCPAGTAYVLLKGNNRYAVVAGTLGDPNGPDQVFDAVTSYQTGNPDPPTNLSAIPKFETAALSWDSPTGFKLAPFELQTSTNNDPNFSTGLFGGTSSAWSPYKTGELIDGRVLNAGMTYYFKVRSVVSGYASNFYSPWTATKSFTMLASAITDKTWTFTRPSGTTGINTFYLPFDFALGVKVTGTMTSVSTVQNLIDAINGTGTYVQTFGWYDNATKQHIGLIDNLANAVGIKDPVLGTHYTPAEIKAMPLQTLQPYQVTVNTDGVTLRLTGYLK